MAHQFMVATNGLNTKVDEILSMEEYSSRDPKDFLPNRHWFQVTVRNPEDQKKWIQAFNNVLTGRWTPNQDREDREHYRKMIEKAEAIMARLEVSA